MKRQRCNYHLISSNGNKNQDSLKMAKKIKAKKDDQLSVQILRATPMEYRDGEDPGEDRPGHVRAASSIAEFAEYLLVVQDDANFLALVEKDYHHVQSIPLPPGPDGKRVFSSERGNIEHKLDLEACVSVPGTGSEHILALGSGSDESREWVLQVWWDDDGNHEIDLMDADRLYSYLRTEKEFCGAGLNIEGVIFDGEDTIRLFQRGNAEPKDGLEAVDSVAEISWTDLKKHLEKPTEVEPPKVKRVTQFDLGEIDDIRLTFSDGEQIDGHILYSASAEASSETDYIAGSAMGILDVESARWAEVIDLDGSAFKGKIEGLVTAEDNPHIIYFVIDDDVAHEPSSIFQARLEGPWYQ